MKPSEAIKEIYKQLYKKDFPEQVWEVERCIMVYLDKIAEREDERIAELKKNIKPMD